jgi:hypothetical protein
MRPAESIKINLQHVRLVSIDTLDRARWALKSARGLVSCLSSQLASRLLVNRSLLSARDNHLYISVRFQGRAFGTASAGPVARTQAGDAKPSRGNA